MPLSLTLDFVILVLCLSFLTCHIPQLSFASVTSVTSFTVPSKMSNVSHLMQFNPWAQKCQKRYKNAGSVTEYPSLAQKELPKRALTTTI